MEFNADQFGVRQMTPLNHHRQNKPSQDQLTFLVHDQSHHHHHHHQPQQQQQQQQEFEHQEPLRINLPRFRHHSLLDDDAPWSPAPVHGGVNERRQQQHLQEEEELLEQLKEKMSEQQNQGSIVICSLNGENLQLSGHELGTVIAGNQTFAQIPPQQPKSAVELDSRHVVITDNKKDDEENKENREKESVKVKAREQEISTQETRGRGRRPLALLQTSSIARRCANCHTESTVEWRRGGVNNEDRLCNRCGLCWRRYGRHRIVSQGKDNSPIRRRKRKASSVSTRAPKANRDAASSSSALTSASGSNGQALKKISRQVSIPIQQLSHNLVPLGHVQAPLFSPQRQVHSTHLIMPSPMSLAPSTSAAPPAFSLMPPQPMQLPMAPQLPMIPPPLHLAANVQPYPNVLQTRQTTCGRITPNDTQIRQIITEYNLKKILKETEKWVTELMRGESELCQLQLTTTELS